MTPSALDTLASRLPQLCDQLADVLQVAGENGTLTGPEHVPRQAAAELRQAADAFRGAHDVLNRVWQTLSAVGGWLSVDAEALAGRQRGGLTGHADRP
jgi:hypothetical protein